MSLNLLEKATIQCASDMSKTEVYKPWGFGKYSHEEVHFHISYIQDLPDDVIEKVRKASKIVILGRNKELSDSDITEAVIDKELKGNSNSMFISYNTLYNEIGFSYVDSINKNHEITVRSFDYVDLDEDSFWDHSSLDEPICLRDKWQMVKPGFKGFDYMESVQRTIDCNVFLNSKGINNIEMEEDDWERLVLIPMSGEEDEDDITGIGNHSDTVKRREDSMLALSGAQGTYLEYHTRARG